MGLCHSLSSSSILAYFYERTDVSYVKIHKGDVFYFSYMGEIYTMVVSHFPHRPFFSAPLLLCVEIVKGRS